MANNTAVGNWWAVAAVYKVIHPGSGGRYLSKRRGERRVFLVNAEGREEAECVGQALAKEYEAQYRSTLGGLVCWRLVKIEEVIPLETGEIGHGTEVYNDWLVSEKRQRKLLSV